MQLGRERVPGRNANGSRIDIADLAASAIDHAVTGDLATAIYAEYDHAFLAAAPNGRAMFLLDEISIRRGRRLPGFASKKPGVGSLIEDLAQHGHERSEERRVGR